MEYYQIFYLNAIKGADSMKKYSTSVNYEKKLENVMEKLGVKDYNYDWNRKECFIEFTYKGQYYRFEHSVDKAQKAGEQIVYVSDCFAQLVLTLEDIARMTSRGIYELQTWIVGMKALPSAEKIPNCFITLGFDSIPENETEIKNQYRRLAKVYHPDCGGNEKLFKNLTKAKDECLKYFRKENNA